MISRRKEDGFGNVPYMEHAADSRFTSTGVDPSWTLLERSHGYVGKEVIANDRASIKVILNYSELTQHPPLAGRTSFSIWRPSIITRDGTK